MTNVKSSFGGTSKREKALYWLVKTLVLGVAKLWFRLSVSGRENLPPSGAFVICPIHRSYLDTLVVGAAFDRRVRFMGKDSLWKARWIAPLLSTLGGFPVSRGTADREALKRSAQVLSDGEPLVLFPEGERKSGPVIQPLFDGAAFLATRARVPIVPVGIGGSERAMRKGSNFVRPVKIHIQIGKPIDVASRLSDSGRVPRSTIDDLTAELSEQIQALFDTAQQRAGSTNPGRVISNG
jgi:1-acyl-sn-glycerol-3-phosphate acyltransferase